MAWVGFENFGQNFAPLADAELKQAYQDYQAQKDINASQRQLQQDRMQAQEAAFRYGLESPLANKIAIDPLVAEQLGKEKTPEGEDPLAHMQDFIGNLNKQYPGVVDEQGKISPAIYGRLMKMRDTQKELEMEAAKLAQKRAADMELLKARQAGQMDLERLRNKNMQGRMATTASVKETPQQRLIRERINLLTRQAADQFTDDELKMSIQAEIEDLTSRYNGGNLDNMARQIVEPQQPQTLKDAMVAKPEPKPAPKPVPKSAQKAAPKAPSYEQWLKAFNAPDTPKNKEFYNKQINKGK